MREEARNQQVADKNMDRPEAERRSPGQARRLHGGVEEELQADSGGQYPAIEIARVAEPVAVDRDEREQADGDGRDQKALNCLAGRTASADRAVRLPSNRPHGSLPISSIAVVVPSSPRVLSRLRSIDRARCSRLALELVRCGNEAIEPGHRAAVVFVADFLKQLGDTVGG